MTILSELARLYERMAEAGQAPRLGFSTEKIGFSLEIDADGQVLALRDKRAKSGKVPRPVLMAVPAAVKRASGIKPNLLWDKTAYALGVTALDDNGRVVAGQGKRTVDEHAAFVAAHLDLLAGADDPGLVALRRFLERWRPEDFTALSLDTDALDQNIVFEFERSFVHDRPAAAALLSARGEGESGLCLVSGKTGPVARLHPSIKGVMGAQSAGASLVAFNAEAYESLGKTQGGNAPVSERAAFAYGAALNALLERKPAGTLERHLRIGDTTVVFWAEAAQAEAADWFELMMGQALNPTDEGDEAASLRAAIADVAAGRGGGDPRLDPETKVFLLGLAPNAARLSVRFWHPGKFGDFARNVQRFWDDLAIVPGGWNLPPAAWSLLYETAIRVGGKAKADTIPPLLGGQVMRAVLTGQPLPRSLLAGVIARIRADGEISGRRAAICRAVINRHSMKEEIPVSLDPESPNTAYNLGRLFAAYSYAEKSYAERGASLRDKYLGGASATPARVFPILMRGYEHNRSGLMKAHDMRHGAGIKADKAVAQIIDRLEGAQDLPVSLNMDEQGKFFVGFYHQWNAFFEKPDAAAEAAAEQLVENDT